MTMSEYTVAVNGLEASITLSYGIETVAASGILFDEIGDTVAEFDRRYSGYCPAEIVESVAVSLMVTRRGIEYDDIADALPAELECHCEDDDS